MQTGDSALQSSAQPTQPSSAPRPILQFTMSTSVPKSSTGLAEKPHSVPEITPEFEDGESCSSRMQLPTSTDTTAVPEKAQNPPDDDGGKGLTSISPTDEDAEVLVASPGPLGGASEQCQQSAPLVSEAPTPLLEVSSACTPQSLDPPQAALSARTPSTGNGSAGCTGRAVLPNRPTQDIARDTKRILEICYGSEVVSASPTASMDDQPVEAASEDPGPGQGGKGRKRPTRKRKVRKPSEVSTAGEGEVVDQEEGRGQDGTATVKKKSSKKKGTVKSATTADDGDGTATLTKKKKKKKAKIKKEVLPRDAAGRVVRKRRKIKGRHKVVRRQFIKKGKDVKTELPTITEDDVDDECGESGDEDYEDDGERDGEEGRHLDDADSVDQHDDDDGEHDDEDDDDDDGGDSDDEEDGEETGEDELDYVYEDDNKEDDGDHELDEQDLLGSPKNEDEPVSGDGPNTANPHKEHEDPMSLELGNLVDCPEGSKRVSESDEDAMVVDVEAQSDTPHAANTVVAPKPLEQSFGSSDCTSTVHEDSSEPAKPRFLASNKRKVCAALFLVTAVAALVVSIMFAASVIGKESSPAPAPAVNSTVPSGSAPPEVSPTLAPSPVGTVSPTVDATYETSTPAPDSASVNGTTSPSNPCQIPGVRIYEAETAQQMMGDATVGYTTSGYCQDGYIEGFVSSGTRVTFSQVEIETTGWYSVRLRYANGVKTNLSLTLQIDSVDVDDFRGSSTGNWSNWMVENLDNVLLHEGNHRVVVWTDEDREHGPLMDWIGFELQRSVTRFEYVTGLLSPFINITVPSQAQVSTLLWMSSIDPMDWSKMTNREVIERFLLVEFYYSTEGDLWSTNNEWLSELHVCFWFGVSCSADDLVTDLMLGKNLSSELIYRVARKGGHLFYNSIFSRWCCRQQRSLWHHPRSFLPSFRPGDFNIGHEQLGRNACIGIGEI
jgi:hypothetical protein